MVYSAIFGKQLIIRAGNLTSFSYNLTRGLQGRSHLLGKQVSSKDITSLSPLMKENLELWIAKLTTEEKQTLFSSLQKEIDGAPKTNPSTDNTTSVAPLTTKQLLHVGLHYSLPFVGFGFLDNAIMIVAGDYIDLTIGTALGISTMAAAALGNAISDVAGVGSAHFVESLSRKLGVPQPNLDPRQFFLRSTTWAINLGRAIGIAIGCILGMIPLLFLPTAENKIKAGNIKDKERS